MPTLLNNLAKYLVLWSVRKFILDGLENLLRLINLVPGLMTKLDSEDARCKRVLFGHWTGFGKLVVFVQLSVRTASSLQLLPDLDRTVEVTQSYVFFLAQKDVGRPEVAVSETKMLKPGQCTGKLPNPFVLQTLRDTGVFQASIKAHGLAMHEDAFRRTQDGIPQNEVEQWHEQHQGTLSKIQQIGKVASCSPQPSSPSLAEPDRPQGLSPEDPHAKDNDRPSKRRRVEETVIRFRDFKPPNDQVSPMHVAARDRLTTILSTVLWEDLQSSQVWVAERQQSLTQALCLFWPDTPGDFVLDLVVTEACAKAVSEAAREPGDALRSVLGDFLFKAMKASDCVKDGGKFVDAVTTLDYEDEDKIVRIFLQSPQLLST